MNKKEIRLLAERIYELDKKVYEALESDLGRVYNGPKKKCVKRIIQSLIRPQSSHHARSNLALIANMGRTIEEESVRKELQREYDEILDKIKEIPESFENFEILDDELARYNAMDLKKRFEKEDRLIICISRSYGCNGNNIGFDLAERMHLNFYDEEIFSMVQKRMQLKSDKPSDRMAFPHMFDRVKRKYIKRHPRVEKRLQNVKSYLADLNRYHGLPRRDAIFFYQSDLLCDMAEKESFVVMGRCADVVLTNNHIPHISIFMTAPMEQRMKHIQEVDPRLTKKQAIKLIRQEDKKHKEYYRFYTGRQWGEARNYDLCINTAVYGVEGTCEMIQRILS